MNRPFPVWRPRTWMLATAFALTLLGLGAGPAAAVSEIEGIWSFKGGQVAIHPGPSGVLTGTVVTPTTFSECTHQAGEDMWTNITPQPDGSYWGLHQWLFETSCAPNPQLGPTAWRVQQKPGGLRDLLVCFSEPGGPQPTIAPGGVTGHVTRSCQESMPTAPLPVVSSSGGGAQTAGAEQIKFGTTIILPSSKQCLRQGSLKIGVRDPRYDPLKEVIIRLKRRTIADVRGVQRLKRGIQLKHLPHSTFTLKVTAITVLDQKLKGKRTYRSCRRASHKIRLHGKTTKRR
jgi:hypothetical protein